MALKLPKQFHPDFARPGVKPAGNVEIDWSNPLARGLTRCILHNSLGVTSSDLANNYRFYNYEGTTIPLTDTKGRYRFFNGFGRLNLESESPHTGSITILSGITFAGSGTRQIFTQDQSNTGLRDYQFRINASNKLEFIPFVGGANYSAASSASLTSNKYYIVGASYDKSRSTNNIAVYVDGALSGAASASGSLDADNGRLVVAARWTGSNYVESFTGGIYFNYCWDRALSASEIAALSRDPYQILKPAQPMMLFTSAGGGGPSTQTLLVSSIVTGEAFGQPGVSFSALSIAMSAIASGEAVGQVTIDTSRSVGLSAIPSLEAFGLYSVTTGAVTVSTLGIASGEAAGLISIASGTYVNPVGIGSGEALGQVSVQALSVDILPVGIGSLEAFGLPDVPREAVTITVQPANYGELMGEPLILVGDVTVAVNSASAGESMGQPEVRLAQMYIRPEGIYSGMMFGRIAIVGGDFVYVASDYAVISPVVKSVVESVVTGLAA